MQRKKVQKAVKTIQSKLGLVAKVKNRVGVICQMDYGMGFPTMKGFEVELKCFEDAVEEQRVLPAAAEQIDAALGKLVEYHIYTLPIDQEFLNAAMLYICTRKLAEETLTHQKGKSIGFMISIDQVTGEIRTDAMDYFHWEKLKQQMEKLCNQKFTYK